MSRLIVHTSGASERLPRCLPLALAASLVVPSLCSASASATAETNTPALIVVVGAAGEPTFGQQFQQWAAFWEKHAPGSGASLHAVGLKTNEPALTDLDQIQHLLEAQPKSSLAPLWLVLLGHGTFDGKIAKFNLRGPDLTPTNLHTWLAPFDRPLVLVIAASSSGPFLQTLSASNRVIITATKSGFEQNFSHFGQYFSESIQDADADLDRDDQTSLLEAFLAAAHKVSSFYDDDGRLATEHALLDDNGDGRGTPSDWFRGVRAVKKPEEGLSADGFRAHQIHLIASAQERLLTPEQRARRDALELAVAQLRNDKATLNEEEYYQKLEPLLLELARLYESAAPLSIPPAPISQPR